MTLSDLVKLSEELSRQGDERFKEVTQSVDDKQIIIASTAAIVLWSLSTALANTLLVKGATDD